MSHFSVGVILPRLSAAQMEAEIALLLEPYSEYLEVPEYDRPCYCVGSAAKKHGREMADKLVGSWGERTELFWAQPETKLLSDAQKIELQANSMDAYDALNEQLDEQYRIFVAPFSQQWHETERDYTESHALFGKPDADCDTCNGSGAYKSEYNPASKWDWYRIGGRFDGIMTQNRQSSENGFNFAAKHETLANNSVPVQELLDRHAASGEVFRSYAIVTPEGEWIERGQMGWWGMSSGDKSEDVWEGELLNIYRKYAALDIVLLDCHI